MSKTILDSTVTTGRISLTIDRRVKRLAVAQLVTPTYNMRNAIEDGLRMLMASRGCDVGILEVRGF